MFPSGPVRTCAWSRPQEPGTPGVGGGGVSGPFTPTATASSEQDPPSCSRWCFREAGRGGRGAVAPPGFCRSVLQPAPSWVLPGRRRFALSPPPARVRPWRVTFLVTRGTFARAVSARPPPPCRTKSHTAVQGVGRGRGARAGHWAAGHSSRLELAHAFAHLCVTSWACDPHIPG